MDTAGPSSMATCPPQPPPEQTVVAEKAFCYVVTAHRPSAVLASAVCAFTGEKDTNLIVSKCTRIEIHKIAEGGLVGVADVPMYGRIVSIQVLHPKGRSTASLLLFTQTMQFLVVAWNQERGHLVTLASGDTRELIARPCDRGTYTDVDPTGTIAAVHQYDGILRVLGICESTCEVKVNFMERLDELAILEMRFLHTTENGHPVLSVLHEDFRTKTRGLKSYCIMAEKGCVLDHALVIATIDPRACFLIPVEVQLGGGVIIVGETSVTYAKDAAPTTQVRETFEKRLFQAWEKIDSDRMLLADSQGTLHMLMIMHAGTQQVTGLQMQELGRVTCASCISYLDSGKVFIGSRSANPQIVELLDKPEAGSNAHVKVAQEFTNLGPIQDFAVVDLDNIGQGQLVACCNTGRFGSLRLVRNGIGITEHASIDIEGIRGAWSVRGSTMAEYDQCLVITFVNSTIVLAMNDSDELDEANIAGFDTEKMTLFCGSLDHDHTIQVTAEEVRLLDITGGAVVAVWECPEGRSIAKVASTGASHILVATGQGHVYLLESSLSGLQCTASTELNVDIACIDIARWEEPGGARLAAVGTWTHKLLLLGLPSMQILAEEAFRSEDLPRSMLFMGVADRHVLLLGMGDGHVAHWQIGDDHSLQNKKVVSLGVKPVALSGFRMNGQPYVFAALDRPAVVHEHNGKLVFSPLNESNLTHLCTFSTEAFPGAIAMCKDDRLMITAIDAIQRLHIRTVPMHGQPRRVAYQASTRTFAVILLSAALDSSSVKILAQDSWEEVASVQLQPDELGVSICSCAHPSKPGQEVYLIGTAKVKPQESEPKEGRLLILRLTGSGTSCAAEVLMEQNMNGALYAMVPIKECPGTVVITCNSQVCVFEVNPTAGLGEMLSMVCKAKGQVVALYAAVHGRTIVVGDLMKSVGMYHFNPEQATLTHVAKEFDARWTTSVAAISDTIYATTDNNHNLTMLRYNQDAPDDHAKQMMEPVVEFNLGDLVNRVVPGNLVMQLPDAELAKCPVYIMATVLGMISLCILLPEHRFKQLHGLQSVMAEHLKGVGGLVHSKWRSPSTSDPRSEILPARNCLDGDLLETALDMNKSEVQEMVNKIPEQDRLPVDDYIKLIEDLHGMK